MILLLSLILAVLFLSEEITPISIISTCSENKNYEWDISHCFSHAKALKSGVYFYTYVLIQTSHISSARWPHEACGYIWKVQVPIFWHLVLGFFCYTMKVGYTSIVWWGYLIYTQLLSYKPRKQFFEEGRKERRKRERERPGTHRVPGDSFPRGMHILWPPVTTEDCPESLS